jgi:phage replication O-like protein O
MASPQLEKGFTRIANEILEHLSHPGINGSEYRILLVVLRKTFGFNKQKDMISLSQYENTTKMGRKQVVETIKDLVGKRILVKENNVYKFNKNWEEWVVCKRPPQCAVDPYPSGQKTTKSSGQKTTYKRKKETNTKDIAETSSAIQVFSLEEKLLDMEKVPNSVLDIIASFIREKPVSVENAKQLSGIIARYGRVAKLLSGAYTNEQIFGAVKKINNDNNYRKKKGQPAVDYTLETVYKQLTK